MRHLKIIVIIVLLLLSVATGVVISHIFYIPYIPLAWGANMVRAQCITGFVVVTDAPSTVKFHGPTWWGNGAKTYYVNTKIAAGENRAYLRYIAPGPYEITDLGSGIMINGYVNRCEERTYYIHAGTPTPTPSPTVYSTPTSTPQPTNTPQPTQTPPPFPARKFGVGMTYSMSAAEWEALGRPLVYSWSANVSYANHFGYYYTPMMWGCSSAHLQYAIAWPRQGDYMLFLNEPESPHQANCFPDTAAQYLHDLHEARPDLRIIAGGVNNSWSWMAGLGNSYYARYGTYPPVAGIHVHAYVWNQPSWDAQAQAIIGQINGWKSFQNQHTWAQGELWVTETGILENSRDFMWSNAVLRELMRTFANDERVTRLYWFAYEGAPGVTNAEWRPTMLVWDDERTPLWWTMRDCIDGDCLGVTR